MGMARLSIVNSPALSIAKRVKQPPPFQNKGTIRGEGKLASGAQNLLLGFRLEPLTEKNFTLFTLADHVLAASSNNLATKRLVDKQKIAAATGPFNTAYDFGLSEFIVAGIS